MGVATRSWRGESICGGEGVESVERKNVRERRQRNHSLYPAELTLNPKRNTDRFIKKNTESNVINQIYSFLWSPEKSQVYLQKLLEEADIPTFYEVMRGLKSGCKLQMNRELLSKLVCPQEWNKKTGGVLKKRAAELGGRGAVALRKLVLLYLRQAGFGSILTSKKMNPTLWTLHIAKCRELMRDLFDQDP